MKQKVSGYDNIYKDPKTGVIVNRSSVDRDRYRIAKQQALESKASQSEIRRLSNELNEIKSLLHQLINK
jgi:hypothetical protein